MEVGEPDTCPVILLSIRQSFVSRWDASAAMTRLYAGEIPLEFVPAEFSSKNGNRIVVL